MKIALLCILLFLFPVLAWGHGDVSKLPPSVQILQYNMLLYMNPGDNAVRNKMALACIAAGKLDEAEKQLEQVLEKEPQNFDALDEMGLVLLKKGDSRGAFDYFSRAAAVKPEDMMVYVHKYEALYTMGKVDDAEKELAHAKALARSEGDRKRIETEIAFLKGKLPAASKDGGGGK